MIKILTFLIVLTLTFSAGFSLAADEGGCKYEKRQSANGNVDEYIVGESYEINGYPCKYVRHFKWREWQVGPRYHFMHGLYGRDNGKTVFLYCENQECFFFSISD